MKYLPTRRLQHGVLKHPGRGPYRDRIRSNLPSPENLFRTSSTSLPLSQVASNNSSTTMTLHDFERSDISKDDLLGVPIHEKNTKPRIHFKGLENSLPYPYSRQDSDAAGSLSIATDDDDSDRYDWSDEEDLVDEETKFRSQMGQKPKKNGWGFKRSV